MRKIEHQLLGGVYLHPLLIDIMATLEPAHVIFMPFWILMVAPSIIALQNKTGA